MKKRWVYPNDPQWKELRLKKLEKGLRFAESIGDMQMCRIITKEMRNVLLKD